MGRIPTEAMDPPPRPDIEGKIVVKVSLHGEPCKRKDVYAIACAMTVEVGKTRGVFKSTGGVELRVPQDFKDVCSGKPWSEAMQYMRVMGRDNEGGV